MSRSKRTQKEIQDKSKKDLFDYVGDAYVESRLKEIEFQPSTLETIDGAMLRFLKEEVDLSATTNDGFVRVPVIWVSAERAYQIKNDPSLRDKGEPSLILPLISINRASVTKDPNKRGTVYANLYPVNDEKGGTITVARRINQKKTAEFQNAYESRKWGGSDPPRVRQSGFNATKRNMNTQRVVYETITMPLPTWITVNYEVTIRTEYQQQMNELIRPFFTLPGNSRMPDRITYEEHAYELFVDGSFANGSNAVGVGMEQRNFETTINIEVLGYLMGEGANQKRPSIVRRENAVEIKLPREHVIVGDVPENDYYNIKDGFYRE